jgi:hypothetical protein
MTISSALLHVFDRLTDPRFLLAVAILVLVIRLDEYSFHLLSVATLFGARALEARVKRRKPAK